MIRRARLRLTLAYAGVFVAMLVVLGGVAYFSLRTLLIEEVDRGVRSVVESWLATAPSLDVLSPLDLERDFDGETADVFLLVFRADGALLANPREVEAEEFVEDELIDPALRGRTYWTTFREHGDRFRVMIAPVIEGQRVVGAVVGGRSLESHDRQLESLLVVLLGVGGAGLLMAGAAGYFFAGRALRPLETAYERQRAFIGDASHELRSPLAVIRASAEVMLREPVSDTQAESLEDVRDTAVEASALVDDLLELARLEGAPSARRQAASIDVAAVAADVVRQMGPLIEHHESPVTLRGGAVMTAVAEADLRRILRALIENVLAHTPAGTAVEIEARALAGEVSLNVRDRGPGVPEAALPTLFERFSRTEAARTGEGHAGLGLAIVAGHVRRYGGHISARNRAGGGLDVEVRLPASP